MQVPLSSAGDTVLIGSMFEVYDAPPGSRYLIRLPGCDLNQATLRVGVVDIDGYTEGANLSVVGLHFSRPCAPRSVPDWATLALHRLLDFPPFCGRIQPAVGGREPPLACFDYAVPCNAYIEGPSWFI